MPRKLAAKGSKLREPDRNRIFRDRADAGRRLGEHLARMHLGRELVVLGLPRGGIPVACEVAAALAAPVDVLVVRKLGAPSNPELAVGSIASGDVIVYNRWLLAELGLDGAALAPILERERRELARRERAYRRGKPLSPLGGKTAIIVDDGAATGATMHAGVNAVRALGPRRIVVAVPTSSEEAADRLTAVADMVVTLSTPDPYFAVGAWYQVFDQLSDDDVAQCLARTEHARENPSE
jgi:putative phosphoribosyl transferase